MCGCLLMSVGGPCIVGGRLRSQYQVFPPPGSSEQEWNILLSQRDILLDTRLSEKLNGRSHYRRSIHCVVLDMPTNSRITILHNRL